MEADDRVGNHLSVTFTRFPPAAASVANCAREGAICTLPTHIDDHLPCRPAEGWNSLERLRVQQGDGQQIRKSVYTGKMHLPCGGTGTRLRMENGRGSGREVFQEEASQHRSPTAGPHSGRIGTLGHKFFTQD